MKRFFSLVLCLAMALTIIPTAFAASAEIADYTALPQGTLENVALGKHVLVSSATPGIAGDNVRNGALLVDNRIDTAWVSQTEWAPEGTSNTKGATAIIDLGTEYPIYAIEVVGPAEGLMNYEINYQDNLNYDWGNSDLGRLDSHMLMWHRNGETNAQVATSTFTIDGGRSGAYNNFTTHIATCFGEKARYIRIRKTAEEAALFAEVRVYSIEPKLIEVTPTSVDDIILGNCNAVNQSYPLERMIDNLYGYAQGPASFALMQKGNPSVPSTSAVPLTISYDLKTPQYIRKMKFTSRYNAGNGDDVRSRKYFRSYASAEPGIESKLYDLGGVGYEIGLYNSNSTSPYSNGTFGTGGASLVMETNPTVASRYASFEWYDNTIEWFSVDELKVWAEDRTETQMKIKNIADWSTKTYENTGIYYIDLGGYYNVKKLTATPDGESGKFRVFGMNAASLYYDANGYRATMGGTILAMEPGSITEETDYDVKIDNKVRYIYVESANGSTLSDLKVWVEDGVEYENIALGKTGLGGVACDPSGNALTSGSFSDMAYGRLSHEVEMGLGWLGVDLGKPEKIETVVLHVRKDEVHREWQRSRFQIWGTNHEMPFNTVFDESQATLLKAVDGSVLPGGNAIVTLDTPTAYRYLYVTARTNIAPYGETYGSNWNSEQPYMSTNVGYGGATGDNGNQTERVFTEMEVFRAKANVVEVGHTNLNADTLVLTDDDPDTVMDIAQGAAVEAVIELDKEYSITSVVVGEGAIEDYYVYGSNDGEDYEEIGIIATDEVSVEFNPAVSYKYIKIQTGDTYVTEVSEVDIFAIPEAVKEEITIEEIKWLDSADGTGNVIVDLTSDTLGASVTVKNTTKEDKDAVLIVALYDNNGILLNVSVSDSALIEANGGTQTFNGGVTYEGAYTPATLKAFLWEAADGLTPIVEASGM